MHVAYLYNDATQDPAQLAEDDDPARSPVVAALRRLGHDVTPLACTLDLADVRDRLAAWQPAVVFNRVESLGGSDALAAALPLLLDTMGLPYTGCPTGSLLATADKPAAKQRLARAGLPTPRWITAIGASNDCGLDPSSRNSQSAIRNSKFILKPIYEHASFQMDDESVVECDDPHQIVELIRDREDRWGRPYFAEQFIDGREFNLSLLGDEPTVLPPAEIDFSAFPEGKPRIVGQRAKFDAGSFEFHNSPRRFDFPPADRPLIRRLKKLAAECWRLFDLQGYARVDFRCDELGRPWILEINANPCLTPDAGFAAALAQAGIGYNEGLQRILDDALARSPGRECVASALQRVASEK